MSKERKIHWRLQMTARPYCQIKTSAPRTALDIHKVTCVKCRALAILHGYLKINTGIRGEDFDDTSDTVQG